MSFGDTHGGHRFGLLNPETKLEQEDEYGNPIKYSPELYGVQEFLWNNIYVPGISEVNKLAKRDDIVVIHLGDLTQGKVHSKHWVTTRMSDQFYIAEATLLPWFEFKNLKGMRLTKGTNAHNFDEASSDLTIEGFLTRRFPKFKNIKTVFHGKENIGKCLVDYSHHGSNVGTRNWTKGNVARSYLRSIMMDEIDLGNEPPHLVLRGHYHDLVEETVVLWKGKKRYKSHIIIHPSLCWLDTFARKVTKSQFTIWNGIFAHEIIDDKLYDSHFFGKLTDLRTKGTLLD